MNSFCINDRYIETDKDGFDVDGSVVTFRDGTTYNTCTDDFYNSGEGFFRVDGKELTPKGAINKNHDESKPMQIGKLKNCKFVAIRKGAGSQSATINLGNVEKGGSITLFKN